METIAVPKEVFDKILTDAETLVLDVEDALNMKVKNRIKEIKLGIKGKTEKELDEYLKSRGVQLE